MGAIWEGYHSAQIGEEWTAFRNAINHAYLTAVFDEKQKISAAAHGGGGGTDFLGDAGTALGIAASAFAIAALVAATLPEEAGAVMFLGLGVELWAVGLGFASAGIDGYNCFAGSHSSSACVGAVMGAVSVTAGLPEFIGAKAFGATVGAAGSVWDAVTSWASH